MEELEQLAELDKVNKIAKEYRVFICYSEQNIDFVEMLHNSLNRISEIFAYVADFYRESGRELKEKIMTEVKASNFIVTLLTQEGVKSQWVNQEIGYAYAHHDETRIIPVREEEVEMKAFLEGREYTEFHRNDYEFTISQIIYDLRMKIPEGLHIQLECPKCGNIAEYPLAEQEKVNKAISSGGAIAQKCDNCPGWIEYNPKTLGEVYHNV